MEALVFSFVGFMFVYLIAGAAVFTWIDGETDDQLSKQIDKFKSLAALPLLIWPWVLRRYLKNRRIKL